MHVCEIYLLQFGKVIADVSHTDECGLNSLNDDSHLTRV